MVLVSSLLLLLFVLLSQQHCTRAVILLTFDVDGTLIHGTGPAAAEGAHAQAFGYAVASVFGNAAENNNINVAATLPRRLYQGSTDGLILLRLARAALQVEPLESVPELDRLMQIMYDFIQDCDDEQVAQHLAPLPGVVDTLQKLAKYQNHPQLTVKCGLVTGNVEGIARRKMKAVGIWDTGALHPPCQTQKEWQGTQHLAFLGGFGSDYCSGDIDDIARNHLDRGEQIAIAVRRCQNILQTQQDKVLKRIVHVGDAPADVLAAKAYCFDHPDKDPDLAVGMVAVATGSYHADELRELAGEAIPGKWEPVVLEKGMADPEFLKACGVIIDDEED